MKLNAVELMDALGSFPAGQDFLSKRGIPEQLASDLVDPMCDDSVRLCVTGLLGNVIQRAPGTLAALLPNREAPLAQTIAGLLGGRELAGRLIALNAWAGAAVHPSGLTFFLRWSEIIQALLASVAATQNEVCKGAMACWGMVLEERRAPPAIVEVSDMTDSTPPPERDLWELAEQRLLPMVLKNLQQKPFPDVRIQTWQLLGTMMQSRLAAQKALPSSELRDLLLDFTSETNSDARIAKHGFVVCLLKQQESWLSAFLDQNVEDLLVEYARQGPHWRPRTSNAQVGEQAA